MMKRVLAAAAALLISHSAALADFTFTQGTGPTAFSFTSATGGTALCAAASTHCFASVPVNTAGAQLFASGNPGVVSNNGTFVTQSTVTQGTASSLNATVVGTGTFVTQSTVTQGTAASLLATVTQGPAGASPWLTSIVGGGNTAAVKAGFGAPATADTALVVGISPNSWDVGSGTGGGKTQRTILDSSQNSVGAIGATAPTNASYNGFLSGANLVGVSSTNPFPTSIIQGGNTALVKAANTVAGTDVGMVVAVANTNGNGAALASASSPTVRAIDTCPSTTGAVVPNNITAVPVKSGATTLCGAEVFGIGAAPAWLKIYNATSATCGSGTPVKRILIPANSTAALGAGAVIPFPGGVYLGTGFTYCVTTGIADSDTGVPAASTYAVNLAYR